MGRIVNQRELAETLDISQKSLSLWAKEGMPVVLETENGLQNQYDTAAVHRWCIARELAKGAKDDDKNRLARLQGDKIEMELAEKRRDLIPAAEVEPAWTSMVLAARQALLSLPKSLASLMAQTEDPDVARDLLEEAIEEVLQKLGSDDQRSAGAADEASTRAVEAAAEDLVGAVG